MRHAEIERQSRTRLLRGAPLGKDAVSRLVARLGEEFHSWQRRDLASLEIVYTWFDGGSPKVRLGQQRVRVPVLVSIGATARRERVRLDLRLAGQETAGAWSEVIADLVPQQIGLPALAIIDDITFYDIYLAKADGRKNVL